MGVLARGAVIQGGDRDRGVILGGDLVLVLGVQGPDQDQDRDVQGRSLCRKGLLDGQGGLRVAHAAGARREGI